MHKYKHRHKLRRLVFFFFIFFAPAALVGVYLNLGQMSPSTKVPITIGSAPTSAPFFPSPLSLIQTTTLPPSPVLQSPAPVSLQPPVSLPPLPASSPPPFLSPRNAPSGAASAGFFANTFHTGPFGANNVDLDNAGVASPGLQWFFKQPFGGNECSSQTPVSFSNPNFIAGLPNPVTGTCITLNPDGSITMFNTALHAFVVTPYQALGYNVTGGVGFGGGTYFEAEILFDGSTLADHADGLAPNLSFEGWPSFWSTSIEWYVGADPGLPGTIRPQRYIELDFFEAPYGSTIHDWGVDASPALNPANIGKFQAQNPNFSAYNRYGMLVIPSTPSSGGSATSYLNNVPLGSVTWTHTDCSTTPLSAFSVYSLIDCQHLAMILNTGITSSMTVKSVDVWQIDASRNVFF